MAEPRFSSVPDKDSDDDLPRTLRREREAQARRVREQELADPPSIEASPLVPADEPSYTDESFAYEDADPPPATVTRLDIPFLHLMVFFLKAVIAAIPALILLVAILWLFGEILTATFPELIKMQVLIRMPN